METGGADATAGDRPKVCGDPSRIGVQPSTVERGPSSAPFLFVRASRPGRGGIFVQRTMGETGKALQMERMEPEDKAVPGLADGRVVDGRVAGSPEQAPGGEEQAMADAETMHSERVLDAVHSSRAAVSAVAASWCRSALHHGLDPAARAPAVDPLAGRDLDLLRAANGELLAVAAPVLDRLHGSVGLAGACVMIADAGGVVLDWRAPDGDAARFEELGLAPGVSWAEATQGTNGIGTCLVEQRPVTIHRDEHFASRNVGVSCMDAPIFDPTGRLVAALDISSARGDHDRAMATMIGALVQDGARSIERDLFCRHYADARIILAGGGTDQAGRGQALLAVDRDDLVIGATRAARQHFRLGNGTRIDPRPLGDMLGPAVPASFDDADRAVLRQALARAGGNVSSAARLLGIGRATFYRRMERVGLSLRH